MIKKVSSIPSKLVNLFSMQLIVGENKVLNEDSAGNGKTERKMRYAAHDVVYNAYENS